MNTNELFAADIASARQRAVDDATRAAADFPADVVEGIGLRAGEVWDLANPLVASGYVGGQL